MRPARSAVIAECRRWPDRAQWWLVWGVAVLACLTLSTAQAAGTEAGRRIVNRAELSYEIGGSGRLDARSEVETAVAELLDVAVVNTDGNPVAVTSPAADAVLSFTVTNTGNGAEPFRLLTRDTLAGDDFDPNVVTLYLEQNGQPGLQIGAAGDLEYVPGANDPTLAPDAVIQVYVASAIPAGQAQNALGRLELRAVAGTIVAASGEDDPLAPGFPSPGTSYPALGDPSELGGNVDAVVGNAHDSANLLLAAEANYQVSAAVVALAKQVLSVVDPGGGSEVRTGSVLTYQITVNVNGSGSAEALRVQDPLPPELEYLPGTLTVTALAPGEEIDDDFLPAGSDSTGYDAASRTLTANLGNQPAGGAAIAIEFQATVQ